MGWEKGNTNGLKRSCLCGFGRDERRSEQKEERPVTGERTDICCVELCGAEDVALGSCRGGWLQVVPGRLRMGQVGSQNLPERLPGQRQSEARSSQNGSGHFSA